MKQNGMTYDVVIVGAGVAGALIAYQLVKQGRSVLMLEAGPEQSSMRDRALLMENYYKDPFKTPESPYPEVPAAPRPRIRDLFLEPYQGYFDQVGCEDPPGPHKDEKKKDWFPSMYERRVGGTTWHWLGTCLRLVPNDFRMRSVYDPPHDGFVDWPIGYEDLRSWYDQAEHELGVAGDSQEDLGAPRLDVKTGQRARYPMPAIPLSYMDEKLRAKADAMEPLDLPGYEGLRVEIRSTPQARNSVPGFQQRPQCCGSASCVPLCPTQAKYDATVHIKLARNNYGRYFTLLSQAVAFRVEVDTKTREVVGIHYKQWKGSGVNITVEDGVARGRVYVLASNAVETPKLLLNSRIGTREDTVANSSGLVGRYLMDHNCQLSYALASEPVHPFRGPLSTSGIESLKDAPARRFSGAFRVDIGNDGWTWPAQAPNLQLRQFIYGQPRADAQSGNALYGRKLAGAIQQHGLRQIRLAALVEPAPSREHRVALSDKKDFLGIPRPRIQYGVTQDVYTQAGFLMARKVHERIFQAVGATQITHVPGSMGAGHAMGTYRMGNDPRTSVVDRYQRSHDHRNLFLVGAGTFPTVGASNPTLTLAALALWASDTIYQQLPK